MQCGKDFQASKDDNSLFEYTESDSFTPSGSLEELPLSKERRKLATESEQKEQISLEEKKRALENPRVILPMGKPDEEEKENSLEIFQPEASKLTVENKVFCSLCSFGSPADSKYCFNCGAPIDEAEERITDNFGQDGSIPLAPPEEYTFDTSTLAPMRPSHDEGLTPAKKEKKIKVRWEFRWGIQEWIAVIIVTCAVGFAVWFFLLGGSDIFTYEAKKIRQAGNTMENLTSFQYASRGAVEGKESGVYELSGHANYIKPEKFEVFFSTSHPQKGPRRYHQIRISNKSYSLKEDRWVKLKSGEAVFGIGGLWKSFTSVENLGRKNINGREFHNYRYRVPARNLTSMFGVQNPDAVSDAVVEIFIDSTTHYINRITAVLYNFEIEVERSTLKLEFNLVAVNQPFQITKPI